MERKVDDAKELTIKLYIEKTTIGSAVQVRRRKINIQFDCDTKEECSKDPKLQYKVEF